MAYSKTVHKVGVGFIVLALVVFMGCDSVVPTLPDGFLDNFPDGLPDNLPDDILDKLPDGLRDKLSDNLPKAPPPTPKAIPSMPKDDLPVPKDPIPPPLPKGIPTEPDVGTVEPAMPALAASYTISEGNGVFTLHSERFTVGAMLDPRHISISIGSARHVLSNATTASPVTASKELVLNLGNAVDKPTLHGLIRKSGVAEGDDLPSTISLAEGWGGPGTQVFEDNAAITIETLPPDPQLVSAMYHGSTKQLLLTGRGLLKFPGDNNDIHLNTFAIGGEGGSSHVLSGKVDVGGTEGNSNSITITLGTEDQSLVAGLLNKVGEQAEGSGAYTLSIGSGWNTIGLSVHADIPITVEDTAEPTITRVRYYIEEDELILLVEGTFIQVPGDNNDIDPSKFLISADGVVGTPLTANDFSSIDIRSATQFRITISDTVEQEALLSGFISGEAGMYALSAWNGPTSTAIDINSRISVTSSMPPVSALDATVGIRKMIINWTNPANDTFSHSLIDWSPNGPDEPIRIAGEGNSSLHELRGLSPETEYSITVVAVSVEAGSDGGDNRYIQSPAPPITRRTKPLPILTMDLSGARSLVTESSPAQIVTLRSNVVLEEDISAHIVLRNTANPLSPSDYAISDFDGEGTLYTVTLRQGRMEGSFTIASIDDSIEEGNEGVIFELQDREGLYSTGTDTSYEFTIEGNDNYLGFEFPGSHTVEEAARDIVVAISVYGTEAEGWRRPIRARGGTGVYMNISGSAGRGADYTLSGVRHVGGAGGNNYELLIPHGTKETTFTITLIDDLVYNESTETIDITILPRPSYNIPGGRNRYILRVTGDR